jgi:hypothetical protein
LPLTGRGIGAPVRPPVVWLNRAPVAVISGSVLSSGNSAGWNVTSRCGLHPNLVREMYPRPAYPAFTTRPSSTSIQDARRLANRNPSPANSPSRSVRTSGGGSSNWLAPAANPALNMPETDSDGIHDTLVTDDSKRMPPPLLYWLCLCCMTGRRSFHPAA